MKTFLEMRETKSREELVQLIGLPTSYAFSRFKEQIPIHAVVVTEPLFAKVEISKLERWHHAIPGWDGIPLPEDDWKIHSLQPPESFAVKSIGVIFSPGSDPEDRQRFADGYELTFWIGQRRYYRSPVSFLFSTAESNQFDKTRTLKGVADLDTFPQVIPPHVPFHVTLAGNPFELHAPLTLWVALLGLYVQGVC